MDWQIKTMAVKSSASEAKFEDGDIVTCLIYKDPEVEGLCRADLLNSEVEGFEHSGILLGRWQRIIKSDANEAEDPRELITAADDFFCSLFEQDDPEEAEENKERSALKHLLALLLERKRILKPKGARATTGSQTYVHPKLQREFEVPVILIDAQMMQTITETMGDIFLQL